MSKQEPSCFETDQLDDQSQNQQPESHQKASDGSESEQVADVTPDDAKIEVNRYNLGKEIDTLKPTSNKLQKKPPPYVRPVPDWRFPRQDPYTLRHILLAILSSAIVTFLAFTAYMGHLGFQKPVETYFFSEKAHQTIVINNDQGLITIHSQPYGPYGFRVERYSQGFGPGLLGMDVDYTQYQAVTTLNAHMQSDVLFAGTRRINIDVTVPTYDDLQVHTGQGSIILNNLLGNVVATTDNGSLIAKNCHGEMTLNTALGSISVSRFSGQLVTTAQQGDIEASQVQLNGQSSALAYSGAITLNGALDRHGKYNFTTNDGPISLALPEKSDFHLAINSVFGSVSNEFVQPVHGKQPQATITIHTGLGAFFLHKTK